MTDHNYVRVIVATPDLSNRMNGTGVEERGLRHGQLALIRNIN